MQICEKCAHCNDDEVKFCVMCGKKFEIHSETNQVANSDIKICEFKIVFGLITGH